MEAVFWDMHNFRGTGSAATDGVVITYQSMGVFRRFAL
jgi:hypothetical protein